MKTDTPSQETPLDGGERLIDAMLHEHARLGNRADALFLQRLDKRLLDGSVVSLPQHHIRPAVFGLLAAAAAVALVAGLMWMNRPVSGKYPEIADSSSHAKPADMPNGIPLLTGFPPELIEGTPKPINVPRLVAVPTEPPTLMVPRETELLSRGKPVTSSDDAPIIGDLALITDGDKEAGEGFFVELLDGLQWVQIDLDQSADIQAVWLWHFHSQRRAYHDVIIQISDDPEFKEGVRTVYNNDYDNSAGMGKGADHPYVDTRFGLLVNAGSTHGRYVRLYSNGNTSNEMNHYIEVEVFGVRK